MAVQDPTSARPTSTGAHVAIIASWHHLPMRVRAAAALTDDALYDLCAANPDLRIERTADGELIIMPPTGGETGVRNARITAQLVVWADRDGSGVTFDSSAGFVLPSGAERAPDASWVLNERWNALSPEQRRKLVPLCPDFVLELMSPNDDLEEVREKMAEYIDNGARLGWLVDPDRRRAHVYRPGRAPEVLDGPDELRGDPDLRGLILDLRSIW
jgi:Uma2 family endonuclease